MPNTELLSGAIGAGRDVTQRTLEAGQRTSDRVESLLRELLQTNLDQVEQAQKIIEELIDRSRKASERLVEVIDAEVRSQVEALTIATRADIRRLEERVAELEGSTTTTAKKPAARTTAAKTTAARKTAAKTAAKTTAATRPAAKKAAAKKAAAPASGSSPATS